MNSNDISNLLNMINKMDRKELEQSLSQATKLLSEEDKIKIMQVLKNKK